ncbi:MAG: ThiF family adenylyltransferase [Candidatus Paceibacterota bacterium]
MNNTTNTEADPTPNDSESSLSINKVIDESVAGLRKFSLHSADAYWSAAFIRNRGYFTKTEQEKLRHTTVAIAGLGAVGGNVFLGLVRGGIGSFVITDYDHFEPSNINRQHGARPNTLGRSKVSVLVEEALAINPYLKIKTINEGLSPNNTSEFLKGVDIVVDAMDFFAYRARLSLLTECRRRNLFVVSSGNVGFGASLLIFDPKGMPLDDFLGVSAQSNDQDVMAAFALAWIPRHFSATYTDPSYISLEAKVGPATGVAALLAGSMIITEILRISLKNPGIKPVPHFLQFDFREGKFVSGVLRRGNKGLWQRIRRYVLINKYWGKKEGYKPVPPPGIFQPRVLSLPVPEAVVNAILTAGIQAPSGDNNQPWTIKIDGDKVHLGIEIGEKISYFDYKHIPSLLSVGTMLENISIASTFYGLETIVESISEDLSGPVATISFKLSDEPQNKLFNSIWERNTNRRCYTKQRIPQDLTAKLRQIALSFPGVQWHEIRDKKALRKLAKATLLVDILRSEREDLHLHFQDMLRFEEKHVYKTKDGFPLRNLNAGPEGELFLKLSHKWKVMRVLNYFGFSYLVAYFAYKEILASQSVVLLTIPSISHKDCLTAGRALERVWLEATNHDLSFQPMAALPIFLLRSKLKDDTDLSPRHKKLLAEAEAIEQQVFHHFNRDKENQLIMFRLGYAKPIKVGTLRRPLSSFIKDNNN